MKYSNLSFLFSAIMIICLSLACQQQVSQESDAASVILQEEAAIVYQPAQALQEFFHDAQLSGVFPDSKTFVDCKPLSAPEDIVTHYQQSKNEADFEIEAFIKDHFEMPVNPVVNLANSSSSMVDHLNKLWPILTRKPDQSQGVSSLLALPFPYVVPGGRFREIYYWDSYFTMLGLLKSDQDSLVINMIRNFGHLIDTYGFIPNGNRAYYLGRSQPPFFSSMVMLWAEHHGLESAVSFLPQLIKEHDFWMEGADLVNEVHPGEMRVVQIADGVILNRYWDNYALPRPEAYKEDYELAQAFPPDQQAQVYRDLRAGAESGWDYSSRWLSDGHSLDSIITTQIVPVDLNCLIYFLESSIAILSQHSGDSNTAEQFSNKSETRAAAIAKYFWDESEGYFSDYHFPTGKTTRQFSAAGMVPLYFKLANPDQAIRSAAFLEKNLLFPGGVVSTRAETGQQWDFPNGWAPQQWMAIQGLHHYQLHELADDISSRWLQITQQVYQNTGKMMEKYNVVDLSLDAGGGEYPTQDGFGWTNGVTLGLTDSAH